MICLRAKPEFIIFSETSNINRKFFHQQGNFLLVRFLCLDKENEHIIYSVSSAIFNVAIPFKERISLGLYPFISLW